MEVVYTYRYTVTTRMTCIKVGSDESHFNVSLIVRNKVTRPLRPQNHNVLFIRERTEPNADIATEGSSGLPAYRLYR